jgi:hypothetical protein
MSRTVPTARLLLSLLLVWGCAGNPGPPPPKTYAVQGLVRLRDGTSFANASVYFRPAGGNGSPATGETDADGRFNLHTFHGNAKLPGALEGVYQVMVIARMDRNQSGGGTVTLPTPLTVKPSDDNDFTLTVDPPRASGGR